jgi:hypothetical protein
MPAELHILVVPSFGGRWAVQLAGADRADSVHDGRHDAMKRARELAEETRAELIVMDAAGRIIGKECHGERVNPPAPPD